MPGQVYTGSELSSGITTELRLDDDPPRLLVGSIGWESGMRGSGLRAGDFIVAVDGQPVTRLSPDEQRTQGPRLPGQYQEAQRWADAGRQEGHVVKFTVRRKAWPQGWQTLEVQGTLRYARSYRSDGNAVLLCENGPDNYERDGFNDAWPGWLDKLGTQMRGIATFARWRPGLTTPYELKTLLEQAPRVELLASKYPGAFADAVKADFDDAVAAMRGARFELTDADLAYRRADEERIAEVACAAHGAWQAVLGRQAGRLIQPAFPAEHPVHGRRDEVVGRSVLLERLSTRQWVSEVNHGYFAAGSDSEGWYFLDMESPGAQRMLMALRRYQRLVSNRIREEYTLLARVLPEARVLVMNGVGRWGLQVELQAALIGDALCVEVEGEDPKPPFAGEAVLLAARSDAPPPDAPPARVLEAMIACIKAADVTTWRTLFADWLVRNNLDGSPQVCHLMQNIRDEEFERSRASFGGRLFDARVAWVGDARVLTTGKEYEGASKVEEVEAEIQHIGRFDGEQGPEYRGFMDVTVNRFWTLQRIDGGPWRIATLQSI
jgi:hypothetical protein